MKLSITVIASVAKQSRKIGLLRYARNDGIKIGLLRYARNDGIKIGLLRCARTDAMEITYTFI